MANDEHVAKLREGVAVWNEWRRANPEVIPDLFAMDFRRGNFGDVILHDADLRDARLAHADLRRANLFNANLHKAALEWTKLTGADLVAANLTAADLRRADLTQARLTGANLASADLNGTDFSEAHVGGTVFANTDLSVARGLETVHHGGPSTIGIEVIYRSQGKIPEAFLRGAGVPDNFLTYMRSLAANPIEFYSCFISYSTKDQDFAERLHADLQSKGVRCWFAPDDIQGGKKTHEQIRSGNTHARATPLESQKREGEKFRKENRCCSLLAWFHLASFVDGSVSTPTLEKIRRARFASTSYRTSAAGRTTIPIREDSTGYFAT
jgi:hypothetical protein